MNSQEDVTFGHIH